MDGSSGTTDSQERHLAAIKALAEASSLSLELVGKLYRTELARLEADARITQYLPLITARRTREQLRAGQ